MSLYGSTRFSSNRDVKGPSSQSPNLKVQAHTLPEPDPKSPVRLTILASTALGLRKKTKNRKLIQKTVLKK